MATEDETSEHIAATKMEEATENICSQFGKVVNRDSLEESMEGEDGCSLPSGTVDYSTRVEGLEVARSLKNEVVSSLENDGSLESSSLAREDSAEIPKASQDNVDIIKPILIKKEALENERIDVKDEDISEQLEKDKTETETDDMKELAPEMKHEELDFEPTNADDSMGGKPIEQIVERLAGEDGDIKEEEVSPDYSKTIGGEPIEDVPEDKVSDGLELAGSELIIEKDVPFHGRTTIGEEPNNNVHEDNKVTEELETVGEGKYINEPAIKEDAIPEYSTKSIGEDTMKDDHEVVKVIEELDIVAADKDIGEPTMEEYVIADNSTTTIQEKPTEDGYKEEKVSVGLETPAADKNIGEPINEEDVPEHTKTTIIEDGHEEDKVTKGLEVTGEGKDIKRPIIDKNVALDYSTTSTWGESIKDGDEKYKISEGIETVRGEDIGETLIKKDVPKHSTTTVEEQLNGDHEEDKVNEGFKIVDEGKGIVEPAIKEDVVKSRSTTTIREEPTEGSQEDKIVIKPEVISSNKDFEEPIIENDVPEPPMMCIDEKPTENADKEDKIIEGLEKDIGEPIIKKDVVLDHSKTTTMEKLIQETNDDDKKMEGSETSDANKETDNTIIEEDDLPEQPTTITGQELINDEDNYKVTEELEIPHADKGIGEHIKEEDVVAHTTTTIKEEPIEDGHEEDKVIEGLQVAVAGKDIKESIIDEDFIPDYHTTTREEEPIKDSPGKDKVIKGFKIVEGTDIGGPIIEEDFRDQNTTAIRELPTEDSQEEDKVIKESKVIDVEDFGEPITEKYVPEPYTTNIEEEQTEDDHEKNKVIEGQETTSANKDGGETVIQDCVQDHSTTTIREQPTEHNQEEDKIMRDSVIISTDKHFGDSIKDIYVPEPSATTNKGERSEDDHEEDKEIETQETTSPDKDSGEPVTEEGVQDHSTTTITEQPTEDSQEEDQLVDESKIIGADKDFGNPITNEYDPFALTTVIEGKQTEDDHEQHKIIEGQETTSADKDSGEPIVEEGVQDHSKTTIAVQPTDVSQQEDQKINQSKTIDADKNFGDPITAKNVPEPSTTTTIEGERTKDDHEQDKVIKGEEITCEDKDSEEPVIEKLVQDHSTIITKEQSIEDNQEDKGSQIFGADKDFGDSTIQKCFPKPSTTNIENEQTKEDHEEDQIRAIEGQETSANKDNGEPDSEEGVKDHYTTTIREQPTEGSQEEDQKMHESKIFRVDEDFGDPIKDEYVPEPSTTTNEREQTEDGHEEDKVIEAQEISPDKDSGEPVIEEGVQDHSTTTITEQPTEDSQEEDQLVNVSKIIGADKDFGNPITDEYVPELLTTVIEGKQTEDDHEQHKVIKGQETTSADKDSRATIVEEGVQGHSKTTITEQPIDVSQEEDQKINQSKTIDAEKDFGDPIMAKNVPEPSTTTTIEGEQTKDDHEQDKVTRGEEITCEDKDSEEPVIEKLVHNHSTIITNEQSIEDNQEDKGSQIIGADKDFGDSIIEKCFPEPSTTNIEDERTKEDQIRAIEGQETTSADKDSGEPVREEVVQDHYTTTIREQPTEESRDENQKMHEPKIIRVDKDFGDPIKDEYVLESSTTMNEGEQTEDGHEEDKVIEAQETTAPDKDSGEPVIEEGVQDHSTTTITGQTTEDNQEEDQINNVSKIIGANKDFGDPITDKYVPKPSTTITEGKRTEDGHEKDKVIKGQETTADRNGGEPIIEEDVQDHSKTTLREQPTEDSQEDDQIINELKIIHADGDPITAKNVLEPSTTIIKGEQTEDDHGEDEVTEGQETTCANVDSGETVIEKSVQDHATTVTKEQSIEDNQEHKEPQIFGADKDFGDPIIEKCFPEPSITTTEDEQTEEDKIRAIKGQEITMEDKDNGEPIIEGGVQDHSITTIREQPTIDSKEEDKGSKVIGTNKDIGDPITENNVPELYTTTIEDERTEDDNEEDNATQGQETTNADKDSGETVVEEGVQFHSTTTLKEQPTEDCQEEDKIIKGSKTIDVDKDFGDSITENYVPNPYATIIENEQTEDDREEDQVDGQETSKDKETGEPIIEKDVVPDHYTTNIREELIQDANVDDKIMEVSETSGANEATGNLIIEYDVLEHSTATTGKELVKNIHEEDKVSEGLETDGAKKDTGKPIIEKDISEHSTTATWEEPIKHMGEEDKVHKELKAVSGDEAKDKKTLEDDVVVGLYQNSSGGEKTKNISQEYEVGKELAVTEAGMDVAEQITEDATISDLPTVLEKEEATEGNLEDKTEAEKQKGETKEFDLFMKSISEASDSTPKEEEINFQDEEKQHLNLHFDSVLEARVSETVQKESSQDLNDTSTELNFGTTGMTERIELENIKKTENLDKSQDADNSKETSQEELIQKESSEMFDEGSPLVPLASEEQRNEKIVEYLEGTDDCQHNSSLTEETKGSSSNATESEGTKLVDLPEGLYLETAVNNFRTNTYENEQGYTKNLEETSMDKTIQTEVTDNGEDQWTQNKEVAAFGDPASAEQNLKPPNLTGETEHHAVVGQHKHADDSDTIHKLLEEPAKGDLEIKIYGEDGDMPKVEEHGAESYEMSKEPEFEMFSEQEKIIDEEITLIQKSETRSMQTIATEESGSTEDLGHNDVEHDDIEARTKKEQHSDVTFDTDAMESDLTSARKIMEDGDGKDRNNKFTRDDEDAKSWINDKKEQTDTELKPVMEVEAEIHTTGVRPGTSAEIKNEEVCDEPGRADITAIEKVKEEDCILRDINSVHNKEETISLSREEDKTDSSNLDGKIQPELWFGDKEIIQDAKENPRTAGEVTVGENSHKDEKLSKYQKEEVFESPELAGSSRDAVVIDKNDVDENHFIVCVGQGVVKQSLKEDEQEKTEKEVCLELDTANASDHTKTHITEVEEAPAHFTEFRGDDKVRENFPQGDERNNVKEEVHERLDATGGDKANDKQELPVLPAEQASTEYSPEAEVYEELETAAAEEGARYKNMGDEAGTKILAELVGEQTTNLSSQETKMETNTQGENTEAVFPEEKIEPMQLENLEKIIDKIHITHSSADEAFLESGEQHKDDSEDSVEGPDTISVGDGTVEESSPDQKGKGVKEASCECKDDQKQEPAKVNQIMDKETLADECGSSGMVLLERGIKEADHSDKTQTVLVTDCEDRTTKLDDPPIKIASYEGETMEVSKHLEEESDLPITKMSENRTGPKSETDPEDILGIENSSDLEFATSIMSSKEKLHNGEELPINKSDTSSLTEASQQEMQRKEGHSTEDEEKQEMEIVKKPIKEMSLSTEDSGKNVKHEAPLAEMRKECAEKTNELNIQEGICTKEEGETQVRQLDMPDEMAEKQIFVEVDSIGVTDKKNPISDIEIPSMPASPLKKSLEKTEVHEENHADAQGHELEKNNVECKADERKHNLGEITSADLNSSKEEKVPCLDLLHESKRADQEVVGELEDGTSLLNQAEIGDKEILTAATTEEHITDEDDEEGREREEDDGEKKDDSGSDAPVMVEASREIVVKTTPKKSHNILSGVGSKVKHSISKVKKAITGKSSHHKQLSPK